MRAWMPTVWRGFATALLVVAMAVGGCAGRDRSGGKATRGGPIELRRPVQAVWVARFHYRSPNDIRTIMRNCAAMGLNTVLWQVRGQATVAYRSRIEPWSKEFAHRDPGFDPLAVAVSEAHRLGLRIEAWVNVMPGWSGSEPPPVRDHLYHTRPNWFLHAADGARQPLNDHYVILNPCEPAVRRHIVAVMHEIVTRYDVDGLHLDYVRYAWETTPNARRLYPRDARTVALFRRETGRSPDDDPRAWDHWRANQLTRLVAEIRDMLTRTRGRVTLTAAVWSTPTVGVRDYFQNGLAWLRSGLVDAVMPMAYTADSEALARYVGSYKNAAPGSHVIPGLGIYKHTTRAQMRAQLRRCIAWGGDFALFSYDSLHPTVRDRTRQGVPAAEKALRAVRRAVLGEFVRG